MVLFLFWFSWVRSRKWRCVAVKCKVKHESVPGGRIYSRIESAHHQLTVLRNGQPWRKYFSIWTVQCLPMATIETGNIRRDSIYTEICQFFLYQACKKVACGPGPKSIFTTMQTLLWEIRAHRLFLYDAQIGFGFVHTMKKKKKNRPEQIQKDKSKKPVAQQ